MRQFKILVRDSTQQHIVTLLNQNTDLTGKHHKFILSFGKDSKDGKSHSVTPGPGQYRTKEFLNKSGPKYSIGKSKTISLIDPDKETYHVPGPGQYALHFNNKSQAPQYGLGKSPKYSNCNVSTPGPGQYQRDILTTSKTPNYRYFSKIMCSISKSKRSNLNSTGSVSETPGPGNYATNSSFGKGPKVRIHK